PGRPLRRALLPGGGRDERRGGPPADRAGRQPGGADDRRGGRGGGSRPRLGRRFPGLVRHPSEAAAAYLENGPPVGGQDTRPCQGQLRQDREGGTAAQGAGAEEEGSRGALRPRKNDQPASGRRRPDAGQKSPAQSVSVSAGRLNGSR